MINLIDCVANLKIEFGVQVDVFVVGFDLSRCDFDSSSEMIVSGYV
jgi:hypothetical protein